MGVPVDHVRVHNFRSVADSGDLALGAITLLIGPNNTGKSSLLRAVHMLQGGGRVEDEDIRHGATQASVELKVSEPWPTAILGLKGEAGLGDIEVLTLRGVRSGGNVRVSLGWPTNTGSEAARDVNISTTRPRHLTVPLFSRRKSQGYETVVRLDTANIVDTTDRALTSRIDNLSSGRHAEGQKYRDIVDRVLQLDVHTFVTAEGHLPGVAVAPGVGISLTRMGEGVTNVVEIAAEIASPGRRLFLIEEPENDLHPTALVSLLDVILEAAADGHQFLITTHNDIVLRTLGASSGTLIYNTSSSIGADDLAETTYTPVVDPFEREDALRQLGYEQATPFGWLILEEASAEAFIGEALIPLFAPKLAVLRTVSAMGVGNLNRRVESLRSMILFAHLSDRPQPMAWVLSDGDQAGRDAIAYLRTAYRTWPADRFLALDRDNIEDYYPARFAEEVAEIRAAGDARKAMSLKGALANRVRDWALTDERAAPELAESAASVIAVLHEIQSSIVAGARARNKD